MQTIGSGENTIGVRRSDTGAVLISIGEEVVVRAPRPRKVRKALGYP